MIKRIRNWFRNQSKKQIDRKHSAVWARDSKWAFAQEGVSKVKAELKEFKIANDLNAHAACYYSQTRFFLILLFIPIIATVDITLGYGALSNMLQGIGTESSMKTLVFFLALSITAAELVLGVLKSRFHGIDDKIPNLPWYKSTQEMQRMIYTVLSICCTLVVPCLSLAEYFDSISLTDMLFNMGQISANGYIEEVKSLRIKYTALCFFSIVCHSSLVIYSPKFVLAFAHIAYKAKENSLKQKIEEKEDLELKSRNSVIGALLQFDQQFKAHLTQWGRVGLTDYKFSERVNHLYKQLR